MTTQALGAVAPTALTDTRVELHWLAQVLAATGDAFLERANDDSQSNAAWEPAHSALLGRPVASGAQLGLSIATAELVVIDGNGDDLERTSARGKTLPDLLTWAGDAIAEASGAAMKAPLAVRDYDMPPHPASDGKAFVLGDNAALAELARWFEQATVWLTAARGLDDRASEVRLWPHHFDIGGIIMLEPDKPFEEARQMGFGWSPGDGSYEQPYFYITPFPVPADLPALTAGHWHRDGFTGAILTATEITESDSQSELVATFLRNTIETTLPLISE